MRVVCCHEFGPTWEWIAPQIPKVNFVFINCSNNWLGRAVGACRAIIASRKAQAIVSFGPNISMWCGLWARLLRPRAAMMAHTFNFTTLPKGYKRALLSTALKQFEQIVVFSRAEVALYSSAFEIDRNAFSFTYWGYSTPTETIEDGDFISSVGGEGRDYRTLVEAARTLPDTTFILVVRPHSLDGLEIPRQHVGTVVNASHHIAMSTIARSSFSIIPLVADANCGHVTMVAAMLMGKALIVTRTPGVEDYVQNEQTALLVEPKSPTALIEAINRLQGDADLRAKLGANAKQFALANCTEASVAQHFREWLPSTS